MFALHINLQPHAHFPRGDAKRAVRRQLPQPAATPTAMRSEPCATSSRNPQPPPRQCEASRAEPASVRYVSQNSSRRSGWKKVQSVFPAACTSEKTPLGLQTCDHSAFGGEVVRCSRPHPPQIKRRRPKATSLDLAFTSSPTT
jgi:hypothetical protein